MLRRAVAKDPLRRSGKWCVGRSILLLAIPALVTHAAAEPTDEARAYRARAIESVNRGDPAGALSAIERAVTLAPNEIELYFLRAGVRVVVALDAFKRVVPETVRVPELQRIEQQLRDAEQDLRHYLAQGRHSEARIAEVSAALVRIQDKLDALVQLREAAEKRDRDVAFERLAALDREDERIYERREQSAHTRRVLGWTFMGIGLATGAATLTFALLGSRTSTQIEAGGLATASDIQSTADRGHVFNGLTLGSGITTGVFVGLGVTLLITAPAERRPTKRLLLSPSSVGLSVEF